MENQQNNSSDVDKALKDKQDVFIKQRSDWKEKITGMAARMRNITTLAELQVDLYTSRQEAVEYYYNLNLIVHQLEKKITKKRGTLTKEYNEKDIRYVKSDMNSIIDGIIADHKHQIDIVKSQASYMYETIKTIDNMIFGVKHRIDMENFRNTV